MRALAPMAIFLVACGGASSPAIADPASDAGVADTDASSISHDAGGSVTDAAIGQSGQDATVRCPAYSTPSATKTEAFTYRANDSECIVQCGAAGPFSYDVHTTDPDVPSPDLFGTCSQQAGKAAFCCSVLACTRDYRPQSNAGCSTLNDDHRYAFTCTGPQGKRPTHEGCVPLGQLPPDDGSPAEFCCVTP